MNENPDIIKTMEKLRESLVLDDTQIKAAVEACEKVAIATRMSMAQALLAFRDAVVQMKLTDVTVDTEALCNMADIPNEKPKKPNNPGKSYMKVRHKIKRWE